MNHLKNQISPYLLQHADNPIDWYPWCEEALKKAEEEDKPIFLSIGYSSCHWCHVMAKESFSDRDVARLLNKHFVSIKVDREERPDLDSVYMAACQFLTGSGGWPLSLFLTPERKPFFAGTYYPKHPSRGMMSFPKLLEHVQKAWKTRRHELMQTAEEVTRELRRGLSVRCHPADLSDEERAENNNGLFSEAASYLKQDFDPHHGGFGTAPKFPSGANLLFLMKYYEGQIPKDKELLQMAEKTLLQMYKGGIFDQLGGGFCRYSTDKFFLVPHFEKMLYDNALLIVCFCRAYSLTKKKVYLTAAERTAEWALREMQGGHGAFYSSQDADSEGEEGRFYTFSCDEIFQLLGKTKGTLFCSHYGITERGNFEGKNIPNLLHHEVPGEEKIVAEIRETVFQYRKKRYTIHTDDKVLTSWNGMMIWALAELYRTSRNRKWLVAAEKSMDFFLKTLKKKECGDGGMDLSSLFAGWRLDKVSGNAFLDDYAWLILGLLALYEVTFEKDYLEKARRFMRKALHMYFDFQQGGFYLGGKENESLIFNPKEVYDGAVPSGNSVMAWNLVKLVREDKTQDFEEACGRQIAFLSTAAEDFPAGHCFFLSALLDWKNESLQMVCRDGVCMTVHDRKEGKS